MVSLPLGNVDEATRLPGLATMGTGVVVLSERRSPEAIHAALRRIHASPTPRSSANALLGIALTRI